MSYASECLARGRAMWTDTLQGLRERRTRRWALLVPAALGGMFAMFVVATIPWIILDCNGGCIYAFIPCYSLVAFAAVAAPKGKRFVALGFAAVAIVLAQDYIRSVDANSWIETNGQRFRDPDAFDPRSLWFGSLAGVATAVVLALLRLRSRWLLFFPAIIAMFDLTFFISVIILSIASEWLGNWIWLPVAVCGLAASTFTGYRIAPAYKPRAALLALLIPLIIFCGLLLTAM